MSREPELEREREPLRERPRTSPELELERRPHEPGPEREEREERAGQRKGFSLWFSGIALTLAAAAYLYPAFHQAFFPEPSAQTSLAPIMDSVSAATNQKLTSEYERAMQNNVQFGQLVNIGDRETQQTIFDIYGTEDGQKIISDAKLGATEIVMLYVFDWLAEDGDVVQVKNAHINLTVPIWNAPTRIPVPITDKSGFVEIHADLDGGGGVTVGAVVQGSKRLDIPPLAVNNYVKIPLVCGSC